MGQMIAPSPSELDCLAVVWQSKHEENLTSLRLGEIHRRVAALRTRLGQPEPALTTVSTQVRTLVAKGLLREVLAKEAGPISGQPIRVIRKRGMLDSGGRSTSGYEASYEPGEVLSATFRALASAYPVQKRHEALLDFARALDMPKRTLVQLQKFLDRHLK